MIVVTGATGNVGRPLVRALSAADERVTAVSRRAVEQPPGVRHHAADLAEPASLKPALDGAGALFLLLAGAQLLPGDHHRELLDVVVGSGVRRLVLLSSQGARTRPHSPSHAPLRALEEAVAATSLEWTVLRPGGFHANALMWAESVRTRREVVAPFGDVAVPYVDPADIAEVAAAVLRGGGDRFYELTGPSPISPRERAAAIGAAIGEPVRFVEQTRAEARADFLRFMPEPVADGTLDILGHPTADELAVSPDVATVLGRPARSFADWAARHADAFR